MAIKKRDVISTDDFSKDELVEIIEKSEQMRKQELKKERYSKKLAGKKLFFMFYEPSTRTCSRFKTGIDELGGVKDGFIGTEGTSVKKGESLFYTVKMVEANHADIIILRHPKDGAAQWAADIADIPVINGGDGKNEHPTQSMLDLVTMNQIIPGIDGADIGMGGDLKYGRTVHSLPLALSKFENITLHFAAPDVLKMPDSLMNKLAKRGIKINEYDNIEDALKASQIFYMTRPQKERMQDLGMNDQEIYRILDDYRITIEKLKTNIKVLHPLPIDSKLNEIDFAVTFTDNQHYLMQAENGIFLSKTLLFEILHGTESRFNPNIKKIQANNRHNIDVTYHSPKSHKLIGSIEKGIVIDHIEPGKVQEINEKLKLYEKGYPFLTANNFPSGRKQAKDFIKIIKGTLSERDIKTIATISPDATFNIIDEGRIVEKFKALVCENPNCISLDIHEDVPPRFYDDEDILRCHYCRTSHEGKVDKKQQYVLSLKAVRYFQSAVEQITGKLKELKQSHIISGEDYDRFNGLNDLRKKQDKFSKQRYITECKNLQGGIYPFMQYDQEKDEIIFTKDSQKYMDQVTELALMINKYVLESFYFIDFDPKKGCTEDDIRTAIGDRLKKCGLEGYNSHNIVRSATQYGIENILENAKETNLFRLRPDTKENKDQIIEQYKKKFTTDRYICANLLRVIDD